MAIAGRTPTRAEAASATTITATLPTDRQAGDLVIVLFALTNPGTITPPSGWTALYSPTSFGTGNAVSIAAYYRFSPPSAPAISHTGTAGRIAALCQAYSGVNSTTPIDVTPVVTGATGTSIVANGVTTTVANTLLISGVVRDIGSATANPTIPAGMTSVVITGNGNNGRCSGLAQEARPTAGASGTRTWADSAGATLNAQAFVTALREAVATNATVTPAVVARTVAIPAPTILRGARPTPAVVARTVTIGTPTIVVSLPKVSTFIEDFSAEDSVKWIGYGTPGVSLSGGELHVAATSSYPELLSRTYYDLSNSSIVFDMSQFATPDESLESWIRLTQPNGNRLAWLISGNGGINTIEQVGGSTVWDSWNWDHPAFRYLKVELSDGVATFSRSVTGSAWTTHSTRTVTGGTYSEVRIGFVGGDWGTGSPAGDMRINAINPVIAPAGPTVNARVDDAWVPGTVHVGSGGVWVPGLLHAGSGGIWL